MAEVDVIERMIMIRQEIGTPASYSTEESIQLACTLGSGFGRSFFDKSILTCSESDGTVAGIRKLVANNYPRTASPLIHTAEFVLGQSKAMIDNVYALFRDRQNMYALFADYGYGVYALSAYIAEGYSIKEWGVEAIADDRVSRHLVQYPMATSTEERKLKAAYMKVNGDLLRVITMEDDMQAMMQELRSLMVQSQSVPETVVPEFFMTGVKSGEEIYAATMQAIRW